MSTEDFVNKIEEIFKELPDSYHEEIRDFARTLMSQNQTEEEILEKIIELYKKQKKKYIETAIESVSDNQLTEKLIHLGKLEKVKKKSYPVPGNNISLIILIGLVITLFLIFIGNRNYQKQESWEEVWEENPNCSVWKYQIISNKYFCIHSNPQ